MRKNLDWGLRADFALTLSEQKSQDIQERQDFFIGIKKDKIAIIEKFKPDHKKQSRKFLHLKNQVIMPGLINAHTHLPMTLFRGVSDDVALQTWLYENIFPLEKKFVNPDFVKAGLGLAALECLRFGTTCVADMYFFSDQAAGLWQKFGLRGVFSQCLMDFEIPEDASLGKNRFERFDKLFKKFEKSKAIQISLSPHAPYSCSDELLRLVAKKARETGCLIQIHLSESLNEEPESQKKYNESQVQRLSRLEVLGPQTICAHAVHLSDKDIEILKKSGASIVHNPDSNAKLGSGIAPLKKYLQKNINVALGTDGAASSNNLSLFGVMDLATKIQKIHNLDSTVFSAKEALWAATRGGARALHLEDQIGSLEVGKSADLITIDLNYPHMQPVYSVISQLVYAATGLEVDTVFCQGKPLMLKQKMKTLSTAQIYKNIEVLRKKISAHLAGQ